MVFLSLALTSLAMIVSRLISVVANDISPFCPGRVMIPLCVYTCDLVFIHSCVHGHFDSFLALASGYPVSLLFGA